MLYSMPMAPWPAKPKGNGEAMARTPLLRLVIPSLPPAEYSANYARGRHWAEKQRVTQAAHDEIIAEVRNQGWQGPTLQKAHVKVIFTLPSRRKIDGGSLVERSKPWIDGLVLAGVIADDDLETIGFPEFSHTYERRAQAQTVVEVYVWRSSDWPVIEKVLE